MATEVQTAPAASTSTMTTPQLTVLTRVASIPLISDSLAAVHSTLTANAYTKTPYSAAQALGTKAYRVSEPIQARLGPVIVRADGLANKAVDVVENRYPYPFHAPTEEIYGALKQRSDHAYGVANKTIDDKVRTPAFGIAQGIDQRFAPVVDRFEVVVKKLNGQAVDTDAPGPDTPAADSPKDKFQYQRAYRLSIDLKDYMYGYTSEQIKQIQEHNVLVQRATSTAYNVSAALSTSYGAASARVHALSDTLLQELHSLQASAAALPAQAQASLHGLSERIGTVIRKVKEAAGTDAPISDKLVILRTAVEEQVNPLLETATATVQGVVNAARGKVDEVKPTEPLAHSNGVTVNGNGATNGNGIAH